MTMTSQTVYPYTCQERSFNLKESNSLGNCSSGVCNMGSRNRSRNGSSCMHGSPVNEYVKIVEPFSNATGSPVVNPDGSVSTANETNSPSAIPLVFPPLIRTNNPNMNPNMNPNTNNPNVINTITTTPSGVPMINTIPPKINGNVNGKKGNKNIITINPTQNPTQNHTQNPTQNSPVIRENNATPKDFTYNSYADWRAPSYNQWTRIHDDNCNEENRLRIGTKPMKYYVNQFNSPQVAPFMQYTVVGNEKQYNVRNDYERPVPTRLNPLYNVNTLPYNTTPFLGSENTAREYVETDSNLRWGSDIRGLKSQNGTTEKEYNRWNPGVYPETVQNAGQFMVPGTKKQQAIMGPQGLMEYANDHNAGYYDPSEQNNVLFMNSAVPYFGISSRNLLQNISELSGC